MTQEIKRYRRKVSYERVERAAEAGRLEWDKRRKECIPCYVNLKTGASYDLIDVITRAALEADAEIIEGIVSTYALCGDGRAGISVGERRMGDINQFHDEWEEVE